MLTKTIRLTNSEQLLTPECSFACISE